PVFEWLLMKLSGRKSVIDFDDAIWLSNVSESNWMARHLKRNKNAANCCRWASVVSAGNNFLADYARKYNKNIVINPTVVADTVPRWRGQGMDRFVIGWTGSHSTLFYLETLHPVFMDLEKEFQFELHVICDTAPRFKLNSLRYKPWNKATELVDLQEFSVGVMPQPDSEWARGK